MDVTPCCGTGRVQVQRELDALKDVLARSTSPKEAEALARELAQAKEAEVRAREQAGRATQEVERFHNMNLDFSQLNS